MSTHKTNISAPTEATSMTSNVHKIVTAMSLLAAQRPPYSATSHATDLFKSMNLIRKTTPLSSRAIETDTAMANKYTSDFRFYKRHTVAKKIGKSCTRIDLSGCVYTALETARTRITSLLQSAKLVNPKWVKKGVL